MAPNRSLPERVRRFRAVLSRLSEPLFSEQHNDIYRDSAIKRFELAYEVSWKTLKAALAHEGLLDPAEPSSPRAIYRQALKNHFIASDSPWMELILDRNNLVHSYDQELADLVFSRMPGYYHAMNALCLQLEQRYPPLT